MPTDTGATDVNGAARRLSGLLNAEPLPTDEEKPEEQEAQANEQDADPIEAENLETQEGDTDGEPERYKVKVDGEELEVTLDELQKGYMMESNYRNKTSALAKERESIEAKAAEVDKQLEDARGLIDDGLANLESPEMLELKEFDPESYLKEFDKIQGKIKKFDALQEKRAQEHNARQEKFIQKERAALFDAFPEWQDQKVMAEQSSELMGVMKELGFTDQELSAVTDHRMFVLASQAKQLKAIQKASLEDKQFKSKPKSVKPGTPADKVDRGRADVKAARNKLKNSGSIHDAVKLLQL